MPESSFGLEFGEPVRFLHHTWASQIVVASDHVARVFDMKTVEYIEEFSFEERITSVSGSISRYVFGFSDGAVRKIDRFGECEEKVQCGESPITVLYLHNLDSMVVAGDTEGMVYLIDYKTWKVVERIRLFDRAVSCIEYSDGKVLVGCEGDPRLAVVDLRSMDWSYVDVGHSVTAIRMGYRDEFLYTGSPGGILTRWTYPGFVREVLVKGGESTVTGLVVVFDNPYVVAGYRDGKVKVINLEDHSLIQCFKPYEGEASLSYFIYNSYFETGSGEGDFDFWNINSITPEPFEPEDSIQAVHLEDSTEPIEPEGLFGDDLFEDDETEENTMNNFEQDEPEPELPDFLLSGVEIIRAYDPSGTLIEQVMNANPDHRPHLTGTALLLICQKLVNTEPETVDTILDEASIIFETIGATKQMGDIYQTRAMLNKYTEPIDSAAYLEEAARLFREAGAGKELAAALKELGLFKYDDDPQGAETCFIEAVSLAREHDLDKVLAESLHQLGKLYKEHELYSDAEEKLTEALWVYQRVDEDYQHALAYVDLGQAFHKQDKIDEAKSVLKQGIEKARDVGDAVTGGLSHMYLGIMAYGQKLFSEAETHYREAASVFRDENRLLYFKNLEGLLYALHHQKKSEEFLRVNQEYRRVKEELGK